MTHRRQFAVFLAVVAFWGESPPVRAQPAEPRQNPQAVLREDAVDLARHFAAGSVANAQAAAAIENLNHQRERLSGDGPGGLVNLLRDLPAAEHKALEAILTDASRPVAAALERQVATAAEQRQQLVADWTKVRASLYHQQLELYEVKASQQVAGQVASLLSVDNRWFWLCGVLAVASLAAVSTHERRHEMRRWLFGGRARALGLSKFLAGLLICLTLVTSVVFLLGDHVYQWLLQAGMGKEPSFAAENKKLDDASAKMAAERQAAEKQFRAAFDNWRKRHLGDSSQTTLFDQDEQVRQLTVRLAEELAATRFATAAIAGDLKDLDQANAEIARSAEQRNAYLRQKQWIRGGLGGALLGLSAAGGLAFRRGVRSRQRKTRETCPLCLGEGTFEPLGEAAHAGLEMVRCTNVISEHPYEEIEKVCGALMRRDRAWLKRGAGKQLVPGGAIPLEIVPKTNGKTARDEPELPVVEPSEGNGRWFYAAGLRQFWRMDYAGAARSFHQATLEWPRKLEYHYWWIAADLARGSPRLARRRMNMVVRRFRAEDFDHQTPEYRSIVRSLERVQGPLRQALGRLETESLFGGAQLGANF